MINIHNFQEKHLYRVSLVSIILLPFAAIYGLITILRRFIKSIFPVYKASVKIISIGNITTGGSGKTPFTIFLAKELQNRGCKIAVSHRDYKGGYENEIFLLSDYNGLREKAEFACDEAFLIADNLQGVPVIAGRNRVAAVKKIQKEFPDIEYIILDDSFQHLKLHHDFDFVIFNSKIGIGNGFLLPSGILREPLSALKCADCIIYNGSSVIPDYLLSYKAPVYSGDYKISGIYKNNFSEIEIHEISNQNILLISGIANPASFEDTVDKMHLNWKKHLKFSDHHNYTKEDLENIENIISKLQIDGIITTEKDFVKLRKLKFSIPVYVIEIKFLLDLNLDSIIDRLI